MCSPLTVFAHYFYYSFNYMYLSPTTPCRFSSDNLGLQFLQGLRVPFKNLSSATDVTSDMVKRFQLKRLKSATQEDQSQ